MSDGYFRLIPTDKNWQPAPELVDSAISYVAGLFSGPDDDVWEISGKFYDQVTLIDAGENTEKITCTRCGRDIGLRWFYDLLEEHGEGTGDRTVTVPCCSETVTLSALHYDWPVGFARFEISVMNPTRLEKYELDAGELDRVAALLGHPVTQVLAHY